MTALYLVKDLDSSCPDAWARCLACSLEHARRGPMPKRGTTMHLYRLVAEELGLKEDTVARYNAQAVNHFWGYGNKELFCKVALRRGVIEKPSPGDYIRYLAKYLRRVDQKRKRKPKRS